MINMILIKTDLLTIEHHLYSCAYESRGLLIAKKLSIMTFVNMYIKMHFSVLAFFFVRNIGKNNEESSLLLSQYALM